MKDFHRFLSPGISAATGESIREFSPVGSGKYCLFNRNPTMIAEARCAGQGMFHFKIEYQLQSLQRDLPGILQGRTPANAVYGGGEGAGARRSS